LPDQKRCIWQKKEEDQRCRCW